MDGLTDAKGNALTHELTRNGQLLAVEGYADLKASVAYPTGNNDPPRKLQYPRVNLFTNQGWAGGVAGTPGTAPTGWTFGVSGGTLALVGYGRALTFTVTAARQYLYQGYTVVTGERYEFSAIVTVVSGTTLCQDVLQVKNVSGSSAYYVDGVAANASDAITGTKTIKILWTASADGSAQPSIGAGCNANATQSVTITKPRWKRNYALNPLFHRENTYNGLEFYLDRVLRYNAALTDPALSRAQLYTATRETNP